MHKIKVSVMRSSAVSGFRGKTVFNNIVLVFNLTFGWKLWAV